MAEVNRVLEILSMDGIIVRKIPKVTISNWTFTERDRQRLIVNPDDNEKIVINHNNKEVLQKTKVNELHGYVVKFDLGQGSMIAFSKRTDGFGSTIEEAYNDYCNKSDIKG